MTSWYNKYFVSRVGCLLLRWAFIIIHGMSQEWGILFCVVGVLRLPRLRLAMTKEKVAMITQGVVE